MTIDEALTDCEYGLAFTDQEYDQLAEWLEELKTRRETHFDYVSLMDKRYYDGYNKAIDEFAEKLKLYYQGYDIDLCFEDNSYLSYANSCNAFESYIDEIAEQMKAGGKNE